VVQEQQIKAMMVLVFLITVQMLAQVVAQVLLLLAILAVLDLLLLLTVVVPQEQAVEVGVEIIPQDQEALAVVVMVRKIVVAHRMELQILVLAVVDQVMPYLLVMVDQEL